jgi:uncharacterized protein (DUF433 family)
VGQTFVSAKQVSVEFVVGPLAQEWTVDDVLKEYDHLTRDDVQARLAVRAMVTAIPARG